jgi:hypothetical protein
VGYLLMVGAGDGDGGWEFDFYRCVQCGQMAYALESTIAMTNLV